MPTLKVEKPQVGFVSKRALRTPIEQAQRESGASEDKGRREAVWRLHCISQRCTDLPREVLKRMYPHFEGTQGKQPSVLISISVPRGALV